MDRSRLNALLLITFCFTSSLNADSSKCSPLGEEIEVVEGTNVLTSPGYETGEKLDNIRCMWVINGPEEKYVELNVLEVRLKDHSQCLTEYLDIEYDDSIAPSLRYCGQTSPGKIILPLKSNPRIYFVTEGPNDGGQRTFIMQYRLVDAPESCDSESFACKQPFKCIPSGKRCDGLADCFNGEDEANCGHKAIQPEECGVQKIQPDLDRIVGGQEVVPGSWPWLVSIQGNYIWPSGHGCGGVILNNLYILTAAHCVVGRYFKVFRVKFGDHNQYKDEEGEFTRDLETLYMHPNYNRMEQTDDLAILKLSAPIQYTDKVFPICLPDSKEELAEGSLLYAVGWGTTENFMESDVARQVSVPIISREKCEEMSVRKLPPRTLCTGVEQGGMNPCFGDSGGPLMIHKDGRWVVHGAVSWGPTKCGQAGNPTVYTQISQHIAWIKKTIEQ